MIGFLRFLALILISSTSFAQQGGLFQYLRLKPTTLPSYCTLGDVRFSSSSSLINYCSASNTWSALSLSSTAPMTTLGDMLYQNSTPAPARLAGNTTTTKKYLSQTGTGTVSAAPVWSQPSFSEISGTASLTSQVTGTLPVANGGTSLNSTGLGTILYGDGATSLTTLTGNTAASDLFLRSRGSAGVATAPTWSQAGFADLSGTADLTTQVTGTLPVTNGGTGRASLTNHGVLVGFGTAGVTQLNPAASGTVLTGQGSTTDPSFSATPTLGAVGTQGSLALAGSTSGAVTLTTNAAAGTWTATLPNSAGSSNQFLKTDGTGSLSWGTPSGTSAPNSECFYQHPTGHGSTGTTTRTWTATPVTACSADITYTADATNGDKWTINTAGVYNMVYCDRWTGGAFFIGVTLNSSSTSGSVRPTSAAITRSAIIGFTITTSNGTQCAVATKYLAVNDIIRTQDDGNGNDNSNDEYFRIVRVF